MSYSSSSGSLSSFEEDSQRFVARRRGRRKSSRKKGKGGGSRPGKSANINRNRVLYNQLLMADYFVPHPTYNTVQFRRRFRMRRSLFDTILSAVLDHDSYFAPGVDCCGLASFSTHQKITCALRYMAYGMCADQLDELLRFGQTTVALVVDRFCRAIIDIFGPTYLRPPNAEDLRMIMSDYADKGWIGCMGCIDVMKWVWKNSPMGWRGQYKGRETHPTIALEAVVDSRFVLLLLLLLAYCRFSNSFILFYFIFSRLYFWHAYFGCPGAQNDINVLDSSTLFQGLLEGTAPQARYIVNDKMYQMGYYLADGIYPEWQIMMKTISDPQNEKQRNYAKQQEGRRKDVERGFGGVQVGCFFFFFVYFFGLLLSLLTFV